MTHRERIARIYTGQPADRPGLWIGQPHQEAYPAFFTELGVDDDEGIRRKLHDDCRWLPADFYSAYHHPERLPVWDVMWGLDQTKIAHGQPGCFAECDDVSDVEKYPWPEARYFDFTSLRDMAAGREDCFRFSGGWSHFFHIVADFFGMENYFMKMYTDPEVVHAVTRHVVDFYLNLNRRVFTECDFVDAFFFGNDFGTQEDLLISPEKFEQFVLPYFKELIALAKSYGKPTQLHSCGAISKVIPWLIDAGMDALHPLQAKAKGMDAASLAKEYKGQIVFVGGIDTQELLWRGTPQQVKDEVHRLRDLFGERWIVSPSHEAILPEVPVANIVAMAEAVTSCVS